MKQCHFSTLKMKSAYPEMSKFSFSDQQILSLSLIQIFDLEILSIAFPQEALSIQTLHALMSITEKSLIHLEYTVMQSVVKIKGGVQYTVLMLDGQNEN